MLILEEVKGVKHPVWYKAQLSMPQKLSTLKSVDYDGSFLSVFVEYFMLIYELLIESNSEAEHMMLGLRHSASSC